MEQIVKVLEIPIHIDAKDSLVAGKDVVNINLYENHIEVIYDFDFESTESVDNEDLGITTQVDTLFAVRDSGIVRKDQVELTTTEGIYYLTNDKELELYNIKSNKNIDKDTPLREYVVSIKTIGGTVFNIKCKTRKQKLEIYNTIKEWKLS
jgi:hypothetical protein